MVTVSDDKTVRIWDAKIGAPIGKPLQHVGQVNSAAFDLTVSKSSSSRIITPFAT